jgi:hypothetical protein
MEPQQSHNPDVLCSPKPTLEAVEKLSIITLAALQQLQDKQLGPSVSSDQIEQVLREKVKGRAALFVSWSDRLAMPGWGSKMLKKANPNGYNVPGCPDVSALEDFFGLKQTEQPSPDRRTEPNTCSYVHIGPTVSELCSWLLGNADGSVRRAIIGAIRWGIPQASYGIEPVIASLLHEPKNEYEFYCAVSWCLRVGNVPIRPGTHPGWISHHPDSLRASHLASAWRIVHTMITDPGSLCSVLNEESTAKGLSRPIAHELSRMLFGPDPPIDHTCLVRGIVQRIRHLPSIVVNVAPDVIGLFGRCALTIAASSPKLARSLLSILSPQGLKASTLKTLSKQDSPEYATLVHEFNSDCVGITALVRLFSCAETFSSANLPADVAESLIKLSARLVLYPALSFAEERLSQIYLPRRSHAFHDASYLLFVLAKNLGIRGMRALSLRPRPAAGFDDESSWDSYQERCAQNLLQIGSNLTQTVKRLGLERELHPLIFSSYGLVAMMEDRCIPLKSIEFLSALPQHERSPIIVQALSNPYWCSAFPAFPPSLEVLLIIAKHLSKHKLDEDSMFMMSKMTPPRPDGESLRFLLSSPEGDLPFRIYSGPPLDSDDPWWLQQEEHLTICDQFPPYQELESKSDLYTYADGAPHFCDRIRFLYRFSSICQRTTEPVEVLYNRLGQPDSHFARKYNVVAEMIECSKPLSTGEVVQHFEKLAKAYMQLANSTESLTDADYLRYIIIPLHQKLIAGADADKLGWRRAARDHPDKYGNRDLEREVQAFSAYLRLFGHFESHVLYTRFSRYFCSDHFSPIGSEAISPEDYIKQIDCYRSALAEDRFSFADFKYPQDPSVLCVAIGGKATESSEFLKDISEGSLQATSRQSVIHPPIATLKVREVLRSSQSISPLPEVMQRVVEFQKLISERSAGTRLEKDIEYEGGTLRRRLLDQAQALRKIEGPQAIFARQHISRLETVAAALASVKELNVFLECCAKAQPAYGKEIDSQVIQVIRKLGVQALQENLPSRHRSWTDPVYDPREQLEGCVGVIREELRDAKLPLSPEARKMWKRAFSVRALEDEVERLHALDLQVAGVGEAIVIDVRKSGEFLANISGYVCHTCIEPYPFAQLLEQKKTFFDLHPNASFYTFARRYKDGPRLVGGTFILDVTTDTNEHVWLLRAFNPIQSITLGADVGALFEGFIDAITPSARAEGVKYIAVPYDMYSGRTQTNRPTAHAYIAGKYYGQPQIMKLAPHQPLNSLPVTQACVVRIVE